MLLHTNVFLSGLLHLNFQIETLLGNVSCNESLFVREYIDSEPLRSIVSRASNSKSNLSMDSLDIDLLLSLKKIALTKYSKL